MIINTTLDKFETVVYQQQIRKETLTNVIGIVLLTIVLGDAYFNLTFNPSLSSFICSSMFDNLRYLVFRLLSINKKDIHYLFNTVFLIQFSLLLISLQILRKSTWKTLFGNELLSFVKYYDLFRFNKNDIKKFLYLLTNFQKIKLLLFLGLIPINYMIIYKSNLNFVFNQIFSIESNIVINFILAVFFSWLSSAFIVSAFKDKQTIVGIFIGIFILFFSIVLSNKESLISLESVHILLNASDFFYMQIGLIIAAIFFALTTLIQEKIIISVAIIDSSQTTWTHSNSGINFIRPLFVRFETSSNKIVVMTKHEDENNYSLINTIDENHMVEIENHSFKLWNLSSVENSVSGPFEIKDISNYFQLKGVISLITTITPYFDKKQISFDPKNVYWAMETIFFSGLKQLITDAINKYFSNTVINIVKENETINLVNKITEVINTVNWADKQTSLTKDQNLSTITFNDHNKSIMILEEVKLKLENAETAYYEIVRETENIVRNLENFVIMEISNFFIERIKTTGINHSRMNEAEEILRFLGLRISNPEIQLIGKAANCLDPINKKIIAIEKSINDKRKEFIEAYKDESKNEMEREKDKIHIELEREKNDLILLQTLINQQHISPQTQETIMKIMNRRNNNFENNSNNIYDHNSTTKNTLLANVSIDDLEDV